MIKKLCILPLLCIFVFGYFSARCAVCEDGNKISKYSSEPESK